MIRALDTILIAGMTLIAGMILTGGGKLQTSFGRIELSQVNAWMAILLLFVGIRALLARGNPRIPASPFHRVLDLTYRKLQMLRRPERAFWFVLLGFSALFFGIHALRHWSWHTNVMDMGIVHHSLFRGWNLSPLLSCEICPNRTYLAEHTAFSLILASPWIGIFKSNELLFALESLILACGIAWLVRLGPLKERAHYWVLALLIFLCHPALRNTWIWDFREDHLAFLFLCGASWAAYRAELGWLTMTSILALLCKENIAFILPGLYAAAWLKHRKHLPQFAALTLASLAWIFITFKVLMPRILLGIHSSHEIVLRLPGLGATPEEALQNLVSQPWLLFKIIFGHLFGKTGIHYLLGLLGPWIFVARKAWVWLIPVVPGVLMNLVSGAETQRSMQFHYELAFLPFFMLAVLEGLTRLTPKQWKIALVLAVLFSGRWPGQALRQNWPTSQDLERSRWLEQTLPAEGILGSSDAAFAQAALRNDIRLFGASEKGDWSSFWADQTQDRTRVPGHTLHEAEWLLLDTARPGERGLSLQVAEPWRVHSQSPDGRLVLLTRLPQQSSGN